MRTDYSYDARTDAWRPVRTSAEKIRSAKTVAVGVIVGVIITFTFTVLRGEQRPPASIDRALHARQTAMVKWCAESGQGEGYAQTSMNAQGEWIVIGGCRDK